MSNSKYIEELDSALLSLSKKKKEEQFPSKIVFSEKQVHSGLFKKVAFDVYKVDNDPYESLWLLDDSEGQPFLVRSSIPENSAKDKGDWTAVSDSARENITLKYKNVPIARFSSNELGFSSGDIITVKSALLDKVEDGQFLKKVLMQQPSGKKDALIATFPEFKKFI